MNDSTNKRIQRKKKTKSEIEMVAVVFFMAIVSGIVHTWTTKQRDLFCKLSNENTNLLIKKMHKRDVFFATCPKKNNH